MKTNEASSNNKYAFSFRVQASGNDTVPSMSKLATFLFFSFDKLKL